jgi:excinuclease ABC subunit C
MAFEIKKLETFPTQPGVYLMKDREGEVLYVGKANNLRQRIKQYFVPGGDGRYQVPFLVPKVEEIETIIVFSEKEALLLENNLIKKYQPKYNALFKDDKTYIALKLTTQHPWPMLQLVRYRGKPKPDGMYFGPYTSAHGARQTLDLLQRIFPLRQCSDQELIRRSRPCILYDIKRCIAPCVGKCTKSEYDLLVQHVIQFLKGNDREVLKELYHEMQEASDDLDFEKAATIHKTIRYIEKTIEGQLVDKPLGIDIDVWGIFREGDEVLLAKLHFRDGKLIGSSDFNFSKIAQDDEELITSFLLQHYSTQDELPKEIIIPLIIPEAEALSEVLSMDRSRKSIVLTPQRGDKRYLVEMAQTNAQALFKQEKDPQVIMERTLLEMQETFHLAHYPERIECFDNSNLGSSEPVSALVGFTNGKKDTKRYRTYKINSTEVPNDYAALYEVLTRRYKKAKDEGDLPDLVVVDGGKGHLNIALKVFSELNIITVDLISLAKEEGRHDKGITAEKVFLPNIKDPIQLRKNSNILFFLQRIRDEAHRFVINFQRKRQTKKTLRSSIEEIQGIGPAKRKALLRHFGSLKKIAEASEEELLNAPKITRRDILNIKKYFNVQ